MVLVTISKVYTIKKTPALLHKYAIQDKQKRLIMSEKVHIQVQG